MYCLGVLKFTSLNPQRHRVQHYYWPFLTDKEMAIQRGHVTCVHSIQLAESGLELSKVMPIYPARMTRLISPHSIHLIILPLLKNKTTTKNTTTIHGSCLRSDTPQPNIQVLMIWPYSTSCCISSYILWPEYIASMSHVQKLLIKKKASYILCQDKRNLILQTR